MDMQSAGMNAPTFANASSQVWLVFRSGHHYVFINGDAMELLTVTLSAAALNLFEEFGVTAENVAKSAAEWALAIKKRTGMVDFSTAATGDLVEFYRYYLRDQFPRQRAC
jgi:hypothetical protein